MTQKPASPPVVRPSDVFLAATASERTLPIWLIGDGDDALEQAGLDPAARTWLQDAGFKRRAKQQTLVPGPDGRLAGVAFGIGDGKRGEPSGPSELLLGQLAATVPEGDYHLAGACASPELAALAWGLGVYSFRRYKSRDGRPPRLRVPEGVDQLRLQNKVGAAWLGRDLINTPASDLGPEELETAVRDLAKHHGASVTSVVGDALIERNFPLIHAVGRASPRPPRLIELTWSPANPSAGAPRITLVGKGITFDTGGLDIKPASAMLLMKKDMGGAATAMTLAHMIMGHRLDVRLRLLIPCAENSVGGDAFRPGDVIRSRAGRTVEIGNTDAEGRLVLADAIALADEEAPDSLFVFATLTGAARVALGPDLPAMFTDDDAFAARLGELAGAVGDPLWRLPLWPGYERNLDSDVADMNNIWEGPFAGAIVAALFLKRFVTRAKRFAHFDLYGWRPVVRPLGPKGGDPQTARAVFALLSEETVA